MPQETVKATVRHLKGGKTAIVKSHTRSVKGKSNTTVVRHPRKTKGTATATKSGAGAEMEAKKSRKPLGERTGVEQREHHFGKYAQHLENQKAHEAAGDTVNAEKSKRAAGYHKRMGESINPNKKASPPLMPKTSGSTAAAKKGKSTPAKKEAKSKAVVKEAVKAPAAKPKTTAGSKPTTPGGEFKKKAGVTTPKVVKSILKPTAQMKTDRRNDKADDKKYGKMSSLKEVAKHAKNVRATQDQSRGDKFHTKQTPMSGVRQVFPTKNGAVMTAPQLKNGMPKKTRATTGPKKGK